MQIGPFSQGVSSLFAPTAAANSKKTQLTPSASAPPDQDSTDPKDIIAEIANGGSAGLLKYQEKEIAKKAKEQVLQSLGLKDSDLKNLSPDELSAVDDAVAKAVKAALTAALKGSGKTQDGTVTGATSGTTAASGFQVPATATAADPALIAAQNALTAKSSRQSLLDGSTLSALFDYQGPSVTGTL